MKKAIYFGLGLFLLVCYQNCGGAIHSLPSAAPSVLNDPEQLNNAEQVAQGKLLYASQCAQCHGPIDTSSKVGRNSNQIQIAIANVPQMQTMNLSSETIAAISAALIAEADGGSTVVGEQGRLTYTCDNSIAPRTPALQLTLREYSSAINLLMDDVSTGLKNDSQYRQLVSLHPNDIFLIDGEKYVEQAQFQSFDTVLSKFEIAFRAGQLVGQANLSNYPGTGGCLGGNRISSSCHESFVGTLAEKAFRRTLSQTEINSLATLYWDSSLSKADQITTTFTGITHHMDFLYKIYDRGSSASPAGNLLNINADELAAKVAFFITGTPPDDTLRSLARNGQILDPNILSQQVDRLLGTQQARQNIVRFFRESLGYNHYDSFTYNSGYANGINLSGLQSAMNNEMDNFFETLIFDQQATFQDLFTSRYALINHSGLASIYGVQNGGQRNLSSERSGFLNRAAFLTKRSGFRASPIKRGLNVLNNVLCTDVGAPPPDAPTSLPDPTQNLISTRESAELNSQVPNTSCVFCHDRINPLGFVFENFDTLGRVRSQENVYDGSGNLISQFPVNTQGSSSDFHQSTVNFTNSVVMSRELGNSDRAMMCFAKHLKHFESRTIVSDRDNCQMNSVLETLYGSNNQQGTILQAIRNMVLSDEFRYWNLD